MCGIAGFSGQFPHQLLEQMNRIQIHRGPDDCGQIYFKDAEVGLAHSRLAIIDLSRDAQQPMTVHCDCCPKGLWISYNGELYNYRELRQSLQKSGHQFHSHSDTEVLLHAYAAYGDKIFDHLNGIYAFAILDNDRLLLARDGLGVKPLYYAEVNHADGKGVLFASEIKALLASSALTRELDHTALHYYLAYLWCPGQQTALKAVKKIEPGEALLIKHGVIKKRWFHYDIPFGYSNTPTVETEEEWCEMLRSTLRSSVKRQLISDVPVGAFLSGGLDSSAIVAMLHELQPQQRFPCFTIAFDETMASEGNTQDLPYAEAIAKQLNMDLRILRPKANIMDQLDHMVYHLDEPQADPAPLHVLAIADAAKTEGIKVLLSGTGGDDIFSGYRRHYALEASQRLSWIPNRLKRAVTHASNISQGKSMHLPWTMRNHAWRRINKFVQAWHLPINQQIAHHFLWSSESLRRALYSRDMSAMLAGHDTLAPLMQTLERAPKDLAPLNRMLYLETKHFLADHNLNYTDKLSMATGVEVRVPLLDKELVQFATQYA